MPELSGLGKESRKQLRDVLVATQGTITVEQAAKALKLPLDKTAKLLSRWSKQGWLRRVRRGLYVPVPLEAASPEIAIEDPWIIAENLFAPCYVGGWTAAEYWDLTEQIFNAIVVLTTTKPRDRKPVIAGINFFLKTIASECLFGTKPVWRGKTKVQVSDPGRTIIDLLDDPRLGGGIRPCYDIMVSYLNSENKNIPLLLEYAEKLGNGAVFKRMGYLIERVLPEEKEFLSQCLSRMTKGKSKLDPSLPGDRLVTKWQLWVPDSWKEEDK
jgi:predicted transcriptional regulator of viral defense system